MANARSGNPLNVATTAAVDRRCVLVVYGRNIKTRDAMFALLRAIDLDPIEWEQAIEMTQQGSPYTGHVIDIAFSKAQAAIVLLTGDDVARLGRRHLTEHDLDSERRLTRQARPNLIFEMGMAFGKYPERTVIVEFGRTRELTDVIGRHTIHFRDDAATRKTIADRLTTARCLVNVQGKTEWLTAGDFSGAVVSPDDVPGGPAPQRSSRTEAELERLRKELKDETQAKMDRETKLNICRDDLRALQALQAKMQPAHPDRRLDLNQYEGLVTMLSRIVTKNNITVTALSEETESWNYAAEISLAFTKAGWAVKSIARPSLDVGSGLFLIGGNGRWDFLNDASGNAIELAFRRSEIPIRLGNRGDMNPEDIEIFVGKRP